MNVEISTTTSLAEVLVDMYSGVQRQTLEALELLEEHQVPYVIAIRNITLT